MTRRGIAVLAVGLMLVPLAAVSPSAAQSKEPIRIGVLAPTSGPVAGLGTNIVHGCQAYVNKVNEAGGVNGRKIELLVEDNQFNPASSLAAARKLVDQNKVLAFTCTLGASVGLAIYPYLEQKGIPLINLSEDEQISTPARKYLFAVPESWGVGTEIMLDYAIRQLQKKRIGIVYSTDAAGQSILTTVTRQLAARNMQPAISQALDITATDMSSQALAVKRANAEAVVVQVLGQAGARLAAEFAKLGYRPQILGMSAYNSPRVIQLMGEAGEGLISIAYYHPADSDKPGMQEYRDTMKKYYPDDQLGVEQGLGYSSAAIVVDVLSKIKGDVTSETIVKALEESGPFDQKIAPPVKFAPFTTCGSNPMCRRGQDSAYLVQVKNGKAVPITEFTNVSR